MRRISVFLAAALSLAIAAKPVKADVVIDDMGGCNGILEGDQVLIAGQVIANMAPRINFRLIIADRKNGGWSPSIQRSMINAGRNGQLPLLVTCSNVTGLSDRPDLVIGGKKIAWRLALSSDYTHLSTLLNLPVGVKILMPTVEVFGVSLDEIPF